jgi:hypothetical protein
MKTFSQFAILFPSGVVRQIQNKGGIRDRSAQHQYISGHCVSAICVVTGPVLQRIDVLEREATHLANAARQMRAAINSGQSRLLTDGVLNSRNWMLSVVMSHCFIQSALDALGESDSDRHGVWPKTAAPNAFVVSEFLVQRAGRVGVEDGGRLRG